MSCSEVEALITATSITKAFLLGAAPIVFSALVGYGAGLAKKAISLM